VEVRSLGQGPPPGNSARYSLRLSFQPCTIGVKLVFGAAHPTGSKRPITVNGHLPGGRWRQRHSLRCWFARQRVILKWQLNTAPPVVFRATADQLVPSEVRAPAFPETICGACAGAKVRVSKLWICPLSISETPAGKVLFDATCNDRLGVPVGLTPQGGWTVSIAADPSELSGGRLPDDGRDQPGASRSQLRRARPSPHCFPDWSSHSSAKRGMIPFSAPSD
jgi:hypothetical protein